MAYSLILLHIKKAKKIEQYPIDYTQDIFKKYVGKLKYAQHLFVEKKGINVYYTYLRRMNTSNMDYFGFCFVFTREYIEDIDSMFAIGEDLIYLTCEQNELLAGSMPLSLGIKNSFQSKSPELKRIENWFNKLALDSNLIKPFSGAVADTSNIDVPLNSKTSDEILFAIRNYNHINYYSNKLLNGVNLNVQETPSENKTESNVGCVVLVIVVLAFAIFYSFIYSPWKTEQSTEINGDYPAETCTETAVETCTEMAVETCTEIIGEDYNTEYFQSDELNRVLGRATSEKTKKDLEIIDIDITYHYDDTSYLDFKIDYESQNSCWNKLYIKIFNPNGTLSATKDSPYGYTDSIKFYFSKGKGIKTFVSSSGCTKKYWKRGTYRVEIWCNDQCLAKGRFDI